jgi:hypothetical protein
MSHLADATMKLDTDDTNVTGGDIAPIRGHPTI